MPYLNCYFNALSTSNCYESILGTLGMMPDPVVDVTVFKRAGILIAKCADWNSYMLDYFESTCGSIPPTAMAQMSPPYVSGRQISKTVC